MRDPNQTLSDICNSGTGSNITQFNFFLFIANSYIDNIFLKKLIVIECIFL